MYCKHCGKEIADDSRFCQHCGAIQETDSTSIHEEEKVINKQNTKVSYISYIWRRLMGSAIDKLIILLLCLGVILIISCFDYGFGGRLGIFAGLFQMTKDSVYSAAIGHVMSFYPDDSISLHQLEIDNRFQFLIWLELKIVSLFILINILYYGICEKIISSSFGKSLMNLRLVNVLDSTIEKLSLSKVLYRVLCFFLLMSGIIGLRWLLGFNYYIAVALFFLIMDLPVLFKRASLLDILTKTKLILLNKNMSKREEKTHVDYVEKQVIEDSNKVKRMGYCKFNIVIFLILIFLISSHVLYSYWYASFKYDNQRRTYVPIYYPTERFAGHGFNFTNFDEPRDVKEIVGSEKLFGHYISTLGFERTVYEYGLHHYKCTISTYDISDYLSIIGNNEVKYEQLLSLLAQRAQGSVETKIGDIKSIYWYGKDYLPTKLMGVCCNDRLYIIKVQYGKNLEFRSDWLFDIFDFTYHSKLKYYHTSLLIVTILIGFCCLLFFGVNTYRFKSLPIKNRYAYSLFIMSLLSIGINIIIASFIMSGKLDAIIIDDWTMIVLIGAEATAILSSVCLSVFYYRKSKMNWDESYLVPSILKNNIFNSLKSSKAKKIFIILVSYPLMILSLLPCGFYIALIYSIPLLLVLIYNRWHNWASASKVSNHDEYK